MFLSHASPDDARASDLEAWLRANGYSDLYVDHATTAGGEKWADSLREALAACRVIVLLVTPAWLASLYCNAEFLTGHHLGKRIIPLFLLPDRAALLPEQADALRRVKREDQALDIRPWLDAGGRLEPGRDPVLAERLAVGLRDGGALTDTGLDPEAFAIDRRRRPEPFPGLAAFGDDDADAAVFFGRAHEIGQVRESLRAMRATGDRRPLAILGASGSGKSSLLKAGIIPRLRREAPGWIALRAFRPGAAPLAHFAQAICATLADVNVTRASGPLIASLLAGWAAAERDTDGRLTAGGEAALAAVLSAEAERLRAAWARLEATLLIAIDQAEELVRAEDDGAAALADYLRAAAAGEAWRIVLTVRSDSFPELQRSAAFADLELRGHDLRALPVVRFSDIAERPARRYGVAIEPALAEALTEDAPTGDALPLLAFALRRLWDGWASQGRLALDDYRSMGGLKGLIEDAAERALGGQDPEQGNAPRPKIDPTAGALGEAAFVPALADLNDEGGVIRRVAPWAGFDDAQRALLERFDRWRLLTRRGGPGAGTVEVAHEALFREWPRLRRWLEPERARLETLRALQAAATAWDHNRQRPDYATHGGARLRAARALAHHPRYADRIGKPEVAYIAACRRAQGGRTGRIAAAVAAIPLLGLTLWSGWLAAKAARAVWLEAQARSLYAPFAHPARDLTRPGTVFQDCRPGSGDCPPMVVLPTGDFMMGSPDSDPDRHKDEGPRRPIHVPSFAVSKYDITFDDWAACVRGGGCETTPGDAGFGRGRRPVINVTWDEARAYAAWLSRVTGRTYRLMSEAEWEYAARGVTRLDAPYGRWSFGDDVARLGDYAWFVDNSDSQSHPVGEKRPNGFGLYDIQGNVFQWLQDCAFIYDPLKRDASPIEANSDACSRRVVRGGSWGNDPRYLRSAGRIGSDPANRGVSIGFRLARTLSPP